MGRVAYGPPSRIDVLTLGIKFGEYELFEPIASGGMAEVYRGRAIGEEGFEKPVVIKRILPHFASDERIVHMLVQEARIHAALTHRNIVQIHDLGQSPDGEYFIVLEYVDGHDLAALLAAMAGREPPHNRMSDALALHIAAELAEGVHFAHEVVGPDGAPAGLVHRDISPSNVLLSYSGEVKLSDFGLAKRQSDHSLIASVKGKLAYMSPEQAKRWQLDRRSDIFSMGAVLFELLTGKRLRHIVEEAEGFRLVASGVMATPRSVRPDLSPVLDALLQQALAPNPADRFANAQQMAAAARAALACVSRPPAGEVAELRRVLRELLPPGKPRPRTEPSRVIRLQSEVLGGDCALVLPGQALQRLPSLSVAAPSPAERRPTSQAASPASFVAVDVAAPEEAVDLSEFEVPTVSEAPNSTRGEAGLPAAAPRRRPSMPLPGMSATRGAEQPAARLRTGSGVPSGLPTPPPAAAVARPRVPSGAQKTVPLVPSLPQAEARTRQRSGVPAAPVPGTMHQPSLLEFPVVNDARVQSTVGPKTGTPPITARVNAPVVRSSEAGEDGIGTVIRDMMKDTVPSAPHAPPAQFVSQPVTAALREDQVSASPWADAVDTPQIKPASEAVGASRSHGRGRLWILVVLLLAGAGAAVHMAVVPLPVLVTWLSPVPLVVTSTPDGAEVTVDGVTLLDRTPLVIDVRRDRLDHVVEFDMPGYKPQRLVLRYDKTVELRVTAILEKADPEKAAPPPSHPVKSNGASATIGSAAGAPSVDIRAAAEAKAPSDPGLALVPSGAAVTAETSRARLEPTLPEGGEQPMRKKAVSPRQELRAH